MGYAMNNRETPRSVRNRVSIQRIGAETLVYDERRHKAFCLNETSSVIWRLANGERTVAQITAAAALELNAPVTEGIVLFALDELHRDGLIEPSNSSVAYSTISRREALQRLGVAGALLLPAVAAIVAPTAAQAYSGCVDCAPDFQSAQSLRARQLARARAQQSQQLNGLGVQPAITSDYPQ
jgi:hypothetical protein